MEEHAVPAPAEAELESSTESGAAGEGGAVVGGAVELIEQTVNHPLLTTPFQDYTVTEGLLLLLLLCIFIKACMTMVRRAFAWLLS